MHKYKCCIFNRSYYIDDVTALASFPIDSHAKQPCVLMNSFFQATCISLYSNICFTSAQFFWEARNIQARKCFPPAAFDVMLSRFHLPLAPESHCVYISHIMTVESWPYEWMNEWCIYRALLCIAVHPKRFTIVGGSLINNTVYCLWANIASFRLCFCAVLMNVNADKWWFSPLLWPANWEALIHEI